MTLAPPVIPPPDEGDLVSAATCAAVADLRTVDVLVPRLLPPAATTWDGTVTVDDETVVEEGDGAVEGTATVGADVDGEERVRDEDGRAGAEEAVEAVALRASVETDAAASGPEARDDAAEEAGTALVGFVACEGDAVEGGSVVEVVGSTAVVEVSAGVVVGSFDVFVVASPAPPVSICGPHLLERRTGCRRRVGGRRLCRRRSGLVRSLCLGRGRLRRRRHDLRRIGRRRPLEPARRAGPICSSTSSISDSLHSRAEEGRTSGRPPRRQPAALPPLDGPGDEVTPPAKLDRSGRDRTDASVPAGRGADEDGGEDESRDDVVRPPHPRRRSSASTLPYPTRLGSTRALRRG